MAASVQTDRKIEFSYEKRVLSEAANGDVLQENEFLEIPKNLQETPVPGSLF